VFGLETRSEHSLYCTCLTKRNMMNEVPVFFHRYRRTVGVICAAISLVAAVSGCGQKGDLYLPDDKPKTMMLP